MSTTTARHTVEEYFEVELASELRHEYVDGEILEMVGGSTPHNDITGNLYLMLKSNFRKPKFRVCCGNSRMHVPVPVAYLYPDAAVVKLTGESIVRRLDTVPDPAVLFEILSPSTEKFDRGRKFELYQQIASLEEYVLISQKAISVERFTRREDGTWEQEQFHGRDAIVPLTSLDWSIALSELYEDVEFLPE